ncbi:LOW QUALITY PROTEIN: hypothetical protein PHPALM_28715 [Phytophthora palmivora]|uniref:Uncharacterized protein n=1 Tax=Phytophthora palmivora TaxID=4796 RepID=A0A2P4X9E0_9STRA|nr:LOW QUALITY PROTEIN: hypothetical protein PHPALM_28715 [Phytophthora palmivora]
MSTLLTRLHVAPFQTLFESGSSVSKKQFDLGETASDTRSNKALDPNRLLQFLHGYSHVEALVKIATHGVEAQWSSIPSTRRPSPKNHGSCRRNLRAVTKNIREDQDCGQYTVVEADILYNRPSVICSPLGAAEKKGIDMTIDVSTIHDLSYRQGDSTNLSFKTDSVPTITHEPIPKIA